MDTKKKNNHHQSLPIPKEGKFDVMNVHIYKNLSTSVNLVKLVQQNLRDLGNTITQKAKLAITESNEPLYPCNIITNATDEQRKNLIIDRYVCLNQVGVSYLYYFKTFDNSTQECPYSVGIFNGTFDSAYTKRPAYFGIKNMITTLTSQSSPIPSGSPQSKPGDLNRDNLVDQKDVTLLKSKFGNPYTIFDYNKIITNWGK